MRCWTGNGLCALFPRADTRDRVDFHSTAQTDGSTTAFFTWITTKKWNTFWSTLIHCYLHSSTVIPKLFLAAPLPCRQHSLCPQKYFSVTWSTYPLPLYLPLLQPHPTWNLITAHRNFGTTPLLKSSWFLVYSGKLNFKCLFSASLDIFLLFSSDLWFGPSSLHSRYVCR